MLPASKRPQEGSCLLLDVSDSVLPSECWVQCDTHVCGWLGGFDLCVLDSYCLRYVEFRPGVSEVYKLVFPRRESWPMCPCPCFSPLVCPLEVLAVLFHWYAPREEVSIIHPPCHLYINVTSGLQEVRTVEKVQDRWKWLVLWDFYVHMVWVGFYVAESLLREVLFVAMCRCRDSSVFWSLKRTGNDRLL